MIARLVAAAAVALGPAPSTSPPVEPESAAEEVQSPEQAPGGPSAGPQDAADAEARDDAEGAAGAGTPGMSIDPQASEREVEAIADELTRGLEGLRFEDASGEPYFAEARTVRAELLSLDGSYGGLIVDVLDQQAIGIVEMRVGSHQRDNTNFFGPDSGTARLDVPLSPAPRFMRKKVWLGLDRAFRGATQALSAKKVVLQRLAGDGLPPDFTQPVPPIDETVVMDARPLDREALGKLVAELSREFSNWPSIDNGDVHFQVLRSHESVISTDGVRLQRVHDRAVLSVVADTKAADGMHLDYGLAIHFRGVPKVDDELRAQGRALVEAVLTELEALAQAPLIEEEYDGPILFTSVAATQLLASTVATEISGQPAPLGDSGPIVELEPSWQRRLGKNVMPPFIDLVDDPTLDGFGQFTRDVQGIEASRLVLVDGGELSTLLMTRTPNAKLSGSNGRARMSPALEVGPAISNLVLESRRRGSSRIALERDLLRRAREDGYEFAYVVERLRDGTVLGPVPRDSAAAFAGTGKVDLPLPARIWRIEPGGKRTLVRGAVLAPASMRVLRRIRAVGLDQHTEPFRIPVGKFGGFNADVGMDGVLSQTVDAQITSPELLIEGLELLVERGEHERLPTLVHPLRREKSPAPTTALRRETADETSLSGSE